MYYQFSKKTGGQIDALALRSLPTDSMTTERSPVGMEGAAESFRKFDAERSGSMANGQVRRPAEAVSRNLFGAALMLALGMEFVPTDATAQSPIACGTVYSVTRGDTLFKIAERAFGNGKLYRQIFEANRDLLPDSASVEIGNELLIPCLDGAGQVVREDAVAQGHLTEPGKSEATPAAATIEPAQTTPGLLGRVTDLVTMVTLPMQSIAGPIDLTASLASITEDGLGATELATSEPQLVIPPIRLLTGSGLALFADENLPQGGMITDLVLHAVNAIAPGQQSHVAFVNDWAAHLNYLLPDGAYDVSFPWYKPDCSKSERLNAEMQRRCVEFDFSNPIYEARVGIYTRLGDALVETRTLAALSGKRLCRPNGLFTFDLEQIGLVKPDVSVETQYTAQQCFARLANGRVDVVMLVKSEVDDQLRNLGVIDTVTEIADLEFALTLHAMVSKQSPNGQAHLDLINRGLAELMASGIWFEVVATHQGHQLAQMN